MSDSSSGQLDKTPKAAGEITRLAYARATAKGIRVGFLLRQAGLSPKQIEDPEALLEARRQIKFLNIVAEAHMTSTARQSGEHLSRLFHASNDTCLQTSAASRTVSRGQVDFLMSLPVRALSLQRQLSKLRRS
jgi:hypothetical protein